MQSNSAEESSIHSYYTTLLKSDVFRGFNEDGINQIQDVFEKVVVEKNHTIFSVGDISDCIYIVLEGGCRISLPFPYGLGENVFNHVSQGAVLGEMGVICDELRTANVFAATRSVLLRISKINFISLIDQHPKILYNLMKVLSHRLKERESGKQKHDRKKLNLNTEQRHDVETFNGFLDEYGKLKAQNKMHIRIPRRFIKKNNYAITIKFFVNRIFRCVASFFSRLYVSDIQGVEHIPNDKPVVFLLSFRTYFDYIFFYPIYRHLQSNRVPLFTIRPNVIGEYAIKIGSPLFSLINIGFLTREQDCPDQGVDDVLAYLASHQGENRILDVVIQPFFKRSMRYDQLMEYDHLNVLLQAEQSFDIIPVSIVGTDKFWPFEPWNRKFFDVFSFFNVKSVKINIGKKVAIDWQSVKASYQQQRADPAQIVSLFDDINQSIGNSMAKLEGRVYEPQNNDRDLVLYKYFNERWNARLGLMLYRGLSMRSQHHKLSVRIRHFIWHAEMLNVVLEHLEDEGITLPAWVKGKLIFGVSYPDMEWPYFSMDHSYNPFTKKGMKLLYRFPDMLTQMRKEMKKLFAGLDTTEDPFYIDWEKKVYLLGRMYHFMSDMVVPAHVHNIPHMFLDVPKIGKCDFEEFLGLDEQLFELNNWEIGDISSVSVNTMDEFWQQIEKIARYTFMSSSFSYEQLKEIAKERMITEALSLNDLLTQLRKRGVDVLPVEGLHDEDRFYIRHLTSKQCQKISREITYYSLRSLAACFFFLIRELNRCHQSHS